MTERRVGTDCLTRISKDANTVTSEYTYFLPQLIIEAQSGKAL